MKIKLAFLFLFHLSFFCSAQDRNSIWIFGDSAGIDFRNINSPIPLLSVMDGRGSCASISDTSGNLLLYCYNKSGINDSSSFVYNYLNDTLENGNDLYGAYEYNQIVIIPKPSEIKKFYILHSGIYSTDGLYFSVVDMDLNNGNGKVIQINTALITGVPMGDCVQAIKHGNGRDWWIVAKKSGPPITSYNRFYIFLVSPSGISNPIIQDFNNCTDGTFQKIIVNNKGDKMMQVNFAGFMCDYDFDRCTGTISNPNIIFPEQSSNYNRFFWEGAYSPNDSLFYATTTWINYPQDTSRLLQFNLFAPDIPLSCDTLFDQRNPNIFGAVRLAPDNKIYMTSGYNWGFPIYPYPDSVYNQYNMNLSVINNPDVDGSGCNFTPFSFYLGGKRTYAGLPNNPNYSLGPVSGSACDTVLSVKEIFVEKEKGLLFPNPAHDKVTYEGEGKFGTHDVLILFNCLQQKVKEYNLPNKEKTFSFDTGEMQQGIYFVKHYTGGVIVSENKLVIIK